MAYPLPGEWFEQLYNAAMIAEFHPLQALLLTVSGWVNRHQQHVIEYLVEENRVPESGITQMTLLSVQAFI